MTTPLPKPTENLLEWARQKFRRERGLFQPTANARVPNMLEEAQRFAVYVRTFEGQLGAYEHTSYEFLQVLPPVLNGSLPRIWQRVAGSLSEPMHPAVTHQHPTMIGGEYDDKLLQQQTERMHVRMIEDLERPLRRWLEGLRVAERRADSLERLRIRVDALRRKAEHKFKKAEHRIEYLDAILAGRTPPRTPSVVSTTESEDDEDEGPSFMGARHSGGALIAGGYDPIRLGRKLEDITRETLQLERTLQAMVTSYQEMEQLVWEHLAGLCRDSAWLKSYIASALLITKEGMQGVALALGPCKQPLPAFPHRRNKALRYGEIGDNLELIREFSPRAEALASGAEQPRKSRLAVGTTKLQALRGLAEPLQVAADEHYEPLEPVPPITTPSREFAESVEQGRFRAQERLAGAPAGGEEGGALELRRGGGGVGAGGLELRRGQEGGGTGAVGAIRQTVAGEERGGTLGGADVAGGRDQGSGLGVGPTRDIGTGMRGGEGRARTGGLGGPMGESLDKSSGSGIGGGAGGGVGYVDRGVVGREDEQLRASGGRGGGLPDVRGGGGFDQSGSGGGYGSSGGVGVGGYSSTGEYGGGVPDVRGGGVGSSGGMGSGGVGEQSEGLPGGRTGAAALRRILDEGPLGGEQGVGGAGTAAGAAGAGGGGYGGSIGSGTAGTAGTAGAAGGGGYGGSGGVSGLGSGAMGAGAAARSRAGEGGGGGSVGGAIMRELRSRPLGGDEGEERFEDSYSEAYESGRSTPVTTSVVSRRESAGNEPGGTGGTTPTTTGGSFGGGSGSLMAGIRRLLLQEQLERGVQRSHAGDQSIAAAAAAAAAAVTDAMSDAGRRAAVA